MQFNQLDIDKILMVLGYGGSTQQFAEVNLNRMNAFLQQEYTLAVYEQALNLLDEIATIDTQIKEARELSYVQGSRSAKLNYFAHVSQLKSEGNRAIQEISQMTGIPIARSKYCPQPSGHVSYW
jgi:hypothetical protein